MNKLKKVKICGFLAALVSVLGIAGSQSTTKAIFFQSVHEKGTLNAAYSAAKANPGNVELWKRVAELAEREVRILEATRGDKARIANAKTDAACAAAKANPENVGLWADVATFAEREIMVLGAIGDPIQSARSRAKLASARANAAVAKLQAVVTNTRPQADPENIELLKNVAILAEREAAAWEAAGNQANAAIARTNALGAGALLAHANVSKAYATAEENRDDMSFWDSLADLARREAAAWRAVGYNVETDKAEAQAAMFSEKKFRVFRII